MIVLFLTKKSFFLLKMPLKKVSFYILFICLNSNLFGQNAIVSCGGGSSGQAGSIQFTVGQHNFSTTSSDSSSMSSGNQQPHEIFITSLFTIDNIDFSCTVYPNPTTSNVNLKVVVSEYKSLKFNLFSSQGKLLMTDEVNSSETKLSFENIQSGCYTLVIYKDKLKIKSFKIIKK